ncbi:MAG: ABC transporter permease [Pyrinomonadaceae bacterium]
MPYELFLALKYLRTRRRRGFARATALAAISGIAFGVAALIATTAIANGFRDEMRDKILRGTAHVTLMRSDGAPIANYRAVVSRLQSINGITAVSPTTYNGALLSGPQGSAYAVLRGVDTTLPQSISEIRATVIDGSVTSLAETSIVDNTKPTPVAPQKVEQPTGAASEPNIIIGVELAARTGLAVGQEGVIISGDAKSLSMGGTPREQRVRVTGLFRSGLYDYDSSWVYLSLDEAAHLSGMPHSASVISIQVADIYNTPQVTSGVRELMGHEYTTIDWQEANRSLFAALALERRMVLLIISLVTLIAALNITTTLVLLVVEKRSDIAILTAMGARRGSVMAVFMIEGAIVGVLGALAGALLGIVACALGNHYHLVSLPGEVYSLSNIPFHLRGIDVALSTAIAFVLSLIATIYPARAAASLRPVEALRES